MTCESSIKYELLDLLFEVGNKVLSNGPALGFLVRAVREYTSKEDWCPGNRAFVYKDVCELAFEHGVSSRTINNWERAICEKFGLKIVSRPNRRRYAKRCEKTGRIIHGYGLELTGLQKKLQELRDLKAEQAQLRQRRHDLKRQLINSRGRVRQLATALYALCQKSKDHDLAERGRSIESKVSGRISESATVVDLEQMILAADRVCDELENLLLLCKSCGSDVHVSDQSESSFRPIQHPTKQHIYPTDNCRRLGDCLSSGSHGFELHNSSIIPFADPSRIGVFNVQPNVVIASASERFQAHLPPAKRIPSKNEFVVAAKCFAGEIGIGRDAWDFACQVMGEYPAALCVLVTDNARDRGVRSCGGYFRSLAKRAITGDLSLDKSIFCAWRSRQQSEACHA